MKKQRGRPTALRSWTRLVVSVVAVLATTSASVVLAPAAAAGPSPQRATGFDTQLLQLVNQARVHHGAPQLQTHSGLEDLATWWSDQQAHGATGGELAHNTRATEMLADYGAADWQAWAENVAVFTSSATPQQLFDAYMNSPGHRANILNPTYRFVGIGSVETPDGSRVFNAMEFTKSVDVGSCHPMPDVWPTNVHCENIAWLAHQGITDPADGYFHPSAPVTRGAMVAFLFRLTHPGAPSPNCVGRPFPDVTTSNVFCGYIQWAKSAGVAQGYPDGTYGPDNPVTRAAMAAYLHRIAATQPTQPCTTRTFADIAVDSTFCGVITWMKAKGITYGVGDGSDYAPREPVTRQSMASFLRRVAPLV